jgi:N-methylhydantoinase B/oxoprolinase/acetone carboxylase alpha subunit
MSFPLRVEEYALVPDSGGAGAGAAGSARGGSGGCSGSRGACRGVLRAHRDAALRAGGGKPGGGDAAVARTARRQHADGSIQQGRVPGAAGRPRRHGGAGLGRLRPAGASATRRGCATISRTDMLVTKPPGGSDLDATITADRVINTLRAALFGSVARGEAGPDSDIDLAVELDQAVVRDPGPRNEHRADRDLCGGI